LAQKCWAELGPQDSSSFNFRDGLDLAQPTGLGQNKSNPKQLSNWHSPVTKLHAIVQRELIHVALFTCNITEKGGRRRREEGSLPGVEGAGWWCTMQLEVVRPVACSSHNWKKKEQSPAKEKESSRLELLEWLRRELLSWLPLGRAKASG